jgi:tRNA-binding protein
MHETFEAYSARLLALAEGAEPFDILGTTPARIGVLIAGHMPADLQWTAQPGRWSIAEIVSHLADAEVVFAYRVRMILASPGGPIQAYDQEQWVTSQRAAGSDAYDSLALFAPLRAGNLRLLRSLTADERGRYGVHAERGEESIAKLIRLYAGHDRNHLAQIETLLAAREPHRPAWQAAPVKPVAEPAALEALDVRAGTIRSAVPVAGADRLALLTVSFADRERTIVAGIRTERPSLDAIVGRQCLFVVNLPPKKIRGQLSEGMLFDIGFADGLRPAFAQPEWPVPDGTRAG